MSENFLISVAQFLYLLWPVFILAALFFAFQGIHFRRSTSWGVRVRAIAGRLRFDLFATWTFMFFVWMVTLFASGPNNSILPEPVNSIAFFGGYALFAALEIAPRLFSGFHSQLNLHRARSLNDLKNMEPYRFEDLVTATYKGLGYKATHVGHSGDHGVDIELTTRSGEYWIVQCKRYHGSVGESVVRDLYGSMVSEKASRAILVTTAEITPPAHAWARGKPIDLVDGPRLLDLIDEARRRREGSLFARLARWWLATWNGQPVPVAHTPAPHAPVSPAWTPDSAPRSIDAAAQPSRTAAERTQPVRVAHPVTASEGPRDGTELSPEWQPLAVNSHGAEHHNGSAPICPVCGVRMVRRPARSTDRPGRVLYRCRNYPACRVVLDH